MSKITGGPAFPTTNYSAEYSEGMTLRDYFAAQALVSLATYEEYPPASAAKHAYDYADAMLKAREPREAK